MPKEVSSKLEWTINIPDGTSERIEPESGPILRVWLRLKGTIESFILKIWKFLEKAWILAVAEPKKVIHGLKVGLAISVVSIFYYTRPLYEGVGGNAMWAVMTVVVIFESTIGQYLNSLTFCYLSGRKHVITAVERFVGHAIQFANLLLLVSGATLYKCINRAIGTFLAGSLGVGVHWIANHSGKHLEPIILGTSVFLLGKCRKRIAVLLR